MLLISPSSASCLVLRFASLSTRHRAQSRSALTSEHERRERTRARGEQRAAFANSKRSSFSAKTRTEKLMPSRIWKRELLLVPPFSGHSSRTPLFCSGTRSIVESKQQQKTKKRTLPSMSLTGGESWTPFVAADVVVVDRVAAAAAAAPSLVGLERRNAAMAEVRPMAWRRVVARSVRGPARELERGGVWDREEGRPRRKSLGLRCRRLRLCFSSPFFSRRSLHFPLLRLSLSFLSPREALEETSSALLSSSEHDFLSQIDDDARAPGVRPSSC